MDLLLLAVAFVWGTTFIVVKSALAHVGVLEFLFLRFSLASVLMLILFRKRIWPVRRPPLQAGALLGLFLFAAFAFQTWGLTTTSAADTAFITGLYVVMVPLLSILLLKRWPAPMAGIGVVLAAAGLYVLTGGAPSQWERGEVLVFFCAVAAAFHIILTGHFAPRHETASLATWQVVVVALLSLALSLADGTATLRIPPPVWGALILTAVFATVIAFLVQTYAQKVPPPTRTALIFTAEPVFGALFAHLYGGEALLRAHLLGGGLIFLGMVLSEIRPSVWGKTNALPPRSNSC